MKIAVRVALLLPLLILGSPAAPAGVATAEGIGISIDHRARPTADGGVTFTVRITCPAMPGSVDLRETTAGAGQERTGASGESGLSPDLVCDGTEHTYRGHISPLDNATFTNGLATATATAFACNVVNDDQVCLFAASSERIVIAGRPG